MNSKANDYRMVSWWIKWNDLNWPDDDVYDKIVRRADLMQEAGVNVATVFGAHFRWDFMPIWDCLHDYLKTVTNELHLRGIKLFDHHSAVLVHRYNNCEEMRNVKIHSGPHLPFSPSYQSAESWEYNGQKLNDWLMIDPTTKAPVYLPQYTSQQFCFNNNSFIESYLKYVEILFSETGIDGLMCDDAIFFNGFRSCACEHCKIEFNELTGKKLPDSNDYRFWGNWENQDWLSWQEMRFANNGDFLLRVKNAMPVGLELMSCCSGSSDPWKNHSGQDIIQFIRGCDIAHLEMCGNTPPVDDPRTMNYDIGERLAQASHHLAAAKMKKIPCIGQGYGFNECSANIIWAINKMSESICWFNTLKARLGVADSVISHLPDDPQAVATVYNFEKAHQHLFNSEKVSEVGVYFSYNTRKNSYFGNFKHGYETDYTNTVFSLLYNGVQSETILQIPDDTKNFKIIILPSALCFSDEELSRLYEYEKNGGAVLLTGPFGLRDGQGEIRKTQVLKDYNIDIEFNQVEKINDFWDGDWRNSTLVESCNNEYQWSQIKNQISWNPARIQDIGADYLVDKIKENLCDQKIEIVSSKGYYSSLHKIRNNDTYVLHFLASEFDVEVDEDIEKIRKHVSRVNLITNVTARNVSEQVKLKIPAQTEEISIHFPFTGKTEKYDINMAEIIEITIPEKTQYFIIEIKGKA